MMMNYFDRSEKIGVSELARRKATALAVNRGTSLLAELNAVTDKALARFSDRNQADSSVEWTASDNGLNVIRWQIGLQAFYLIVSSDELASQIAHINERLSAHGVVLAAL